MQIFGFQSIGEAQGGSDVRGSVVRTALLLNVLPLIREHSIPPTAHWTIVTISLLYDGAVGVTIRMTCGNLNSPAKCP